MADVAPAMLHPVDVGPTDVATAIETAVRGEAAGWDWLFDRYHRRVYRYVLARVGDAEVAADIAQEVFVGAVQGIGRLRERDEARVDGWFLGIARHKLADRARRAALEARRPYVDDLAEDPGEVAAARADAHLLRRALERLTDDQRDVVIRRFVLDQSLQDVAHATRRPVGAVKAMQRRALLMLARHLTHRDDR